MCLSVFTSAWTTAYLVTVDFRVVGDVTGTKTENCLTWPWISVHPHVCGGQTPALSVALQVLSVAGTFPIG